MATDKPTPPVGLAAAIAMAQKISQDLAQQAPRTGNNVTPTDNAQKAQSAAQKAAAIAASLSQSLGGRPATAATLSAPPSVPTTESAPAQSEWAWSSGGKPDTGSEPKGVDSAGANVTLQGLRKLGYTGGPIQSDREAAGIKFGLHRESFKPKIEIEQVKLLVGMEIALADSLGFPLLEKLKGNNGENMSYIMRQCQGAAMSLQGRDTGSGDQSEGLHILLCGHNKNALQNARAMADQLIMRVRTEFDAHRAMFANRHSAMPVPAPPYGVPYIQPGAPPYLPPHGTLPPTAVPYPPAVCPAVPYPPVPPVPPVPPPPLVPGQAPVYTSPQTVTALPAPEPGVVAEHKQAPLPEAPSHSNIPVAGAPVSAASDSSHQPIVSKREHEADSPDDTQSTAKRQRPDAAAEAPDEYDPLAAGDSDSD